MSSFSRQKLRRELHRVLGLVQNEICCIPCKWQLEHLPIEVGAAGTAQQPVSWGGSGTNGAEHGGVG